LVLYVGTGVAQTLANVLLCEPSLCHHTELLPYGGKCLRILGYNDDCLLDGAASDIGGSVDQLSRVELTGAAYAE
jgi:hypothetical protein